MTGNNFEDHTHRQLYDMVSGAQPKYLFGAESALLGAASDIQAIAAELRTHADHVQWGGEGAESFREWVADMVTQTEHMAAYAKGTANCIGAAGDVLSNAQLAMPEPEAEECTTDEDKEKKRRSKAEDLRQEAITEMTRLDASYGVVLENFGLLAHNEPKFPTAPRVLDDNLGIMEEPYGSAAASSAGDASSGTAPAVLADHQSLHESAGGSNVFSQDAMQDAGRQANRFAGSGPPSTAPGVSTAVDSVATAPPDALSGQGGALPQGQNPTASPPGHGLGSAPPPPPATADFSGRRTTSSLPYAKVPPGVERSTPQPSRGVHVSRPSLGEGRGTGADHPLTPPRPRGSDGIVGGTRQPSSDQRSTSSLPRGTVAGGEQAPGRTPMAPGARTAGRGTPGRAGADIGRRLASQPGGVVGVPGEYTVKPGEYLPQGTVVGEECRHSGGGRVESGGVFPAARNTDRPYTQDNRPVSGSGHSEGKRASAGAGRSESTSGDSGLGQRNIPLSGEPARFRGSSRLSDRKRQECDNEGRGRRTVPPVIE